MFPAGLLINSLFAMRLPPEAGGRVYIELAGFVSEITKFSGELEWKEALARILPVLHVWAVQLYSCTHYFVCI